MRNSTLREKSNFYFSEDFSSADKILISTGGLSTRQLVYTSLIPIITFRFTCGERKICSTIKKSQNIMDIIVWDKKLSVEHTSVNSKRISKILKCSSFILFLVPFFQFYGVLRKISVFKNCRSGI